MSSNLEASTFWNRQVRSRSVERLLYHCAYPHSIKWQWMVKSARKKHIELEDTTPCGFRTGTNVSKGAVSIVNVGSFELRWIRRQQLPRQPLAKRHISERSAAARTTPPVLQTVPCFTLIYCGQPLSTHDALRPRGRHEPSKPAVQGDLAMNYCRFHNYHTPHWHQLNDRMHCQRLKYYKFTYGRTYFVLF